MKKRIGNLLGKPIIQGDINLKTNNEIHIKELSAGGGSLGGEASTIEYLDVSGMADEMSVKKTALIFQSYLVKFFDDNKVSVIGGAGLLTVEDNINTITEGVVAVAIDSNAKIIMEGRIGTILEFLSNLLTQEELDANPRITKEEFYSLE